jgi:hypothetical protein
MSKSENHWYLLGNAVGAKRAPRRSWLRVFVVWLGLLVLFFGFYAFFSQPGGAAAQLLSGVSFWGMFLALLSITLGGTLAYAFWRLRQLRAAYLRALQAPTAEPLLESIDGSMPARLPDADAFRAQARAFALALYGRGADALQALGEVEWASRAPLVQAAGLSAEYAVALLCERDATRSRELAHQALTLSAVSASLPGAGHARRSYEMMLAAAEAVLGVDSAQGRSCLEQGAADPRYPSLQVLAAYGLTRACERSGEATRAEQLRAFLREVAPHCAPLHASATGVAGHATAVPGPVSQAVALGSSAPATGQGPQARATQKSLRRVVGRVVGLWLLLLALFFAFYNYLSQAP